MVSIAMPRDPDAVRPHRRAALTAVATALLSTICCAKGAAAQAYPTRPIRVIVTVGAGTVSDIVARLLAQHMAKALGQNIIVENISGAGGLIGTEQLVRAPGDGHTIAVVSNNHVINPSIYKRIPYDTLSDITPISTIGTTPVVLAVNLKLPARTLPELLALARSQPGRLTYGSGGNGTVLHLAAVLLSSAARIDIRHVTYKASSQLTTDLLAGHIDMAFLGVATAAEYIGEGQLRPIGVTTSQRSDTLPDVPTLAEQGLPTYDFTGWMALVGPAGLPRPIVDRLHAELTSALASKDVQDMLRKIGVVPATRAPEDTARFFRTELETHADLARRGGVSPN